MSRNMVVEVEAKMNKLKSKKASELTSIEKKKSEVEKEILMVEKEMKEATENTDLVAYEKAKAKREKMESALEMYSGRCGQLMRQELISEKESREVLQRLVKYDEEIAVGFRKDMKEINDSLLAVIDNYLSEVQKIQRLYREWSRDICYKPLDHLPWDNPCWLLAGSIRTKINALRSQLDVID